MPCARRRSPVVRYVLWDMAGGEETGLNQRKVPRPPLKEVGESQKRRSIEEWAWDRAAWGDRACRCFFIIRGRHESDCLFAQDVLDEKA